MICVGQGNPETLADVCGGTYCLLIIIYEFSYHREHMLNIYKKTFYACFFLLFETSRESRILWSFTVKEVGTRL